MWQYNFRTVRCLLLFPSFSINIWVTYWIWVFSQLVTGSNIVPISSHQFDSLFQSKVASSLSPDFQHLQHYSPVSRCRMPVCLLRWREPLPQIPHPVPVLQRLPLLLVCQLCDGPGTGHSVGSLRLLLLGLQEARWHASLPHFRLAGTGSQVRTLLCKGC